MKKNQLLAVFTAVVVLFAACSKDDDIAPIVTTPATGAYVLSEGLWGNNNTTLTYYDFASGSATTDFFNNANGSGLGDTGNDIIIYGSKAYIVVNVSSTVQVITAATGKSLKNIDFKTAGVAQQPRYALGYNGKVYVSCYDGTVKSIDTTTLIVDNSITVGTNPERLTASNGYIYVANSGSGDDSTVSVIDVANKKELKKITVGLNPFDIAATSTGDVYVTTRSIWNNASYKPQIHIIDSKTNLKKASLSADISQEGIRIFNDTAYLFGTYGSTDNVFSTLNTKTNTIIKSNFVTDGTKPATVYGLNINPDNGDIYVTDAKNYTSAGEVFCFGRDGKKKFSFSVTPGINPNTVVFVKK